MFSVFIDGLTGRKLNGYPHTFATVNEDIHEMKCAGCQAVQEQKMWEFSMQKYRRILEFNRNSMSRYWRIRKGSTELYKLSFATKVCTQYKLVYCMI